MMAGVPLPARCAVAVVCADQLISQVYPASVPIEMFLDDVVELVSQELKRRGGPGLESGARYQLHRVDGVRLDVGKTLDELGVEDGTTLVLAPAPDGDSFVPQCESLSSGLAEVGKTLFAPVTADTAAHTALFVLGIVALTVSAVALRNRAATDALAPGLVTGSLGMLTAGAAAAVWRWWPHREDLFDGFAWLATPLLAVGIAAAGPGRPGSAHAFIGVLAAAVLTWAVAALTRRHLDVAAAVMTVCALTGAVAAARMWRPVPAQWLGMCSLTGLLVLVTAAPTVALRAAGIRPPSFGSVTGRDVFRRCDGMPIDAVAPVDGDGESERDPTARGAQIAAGAVRANSVLTGICVGAAAVLPVAVHASLMPGRRHSVAAALLAGLFVLVFLCRGRGFADKRQAVAVVCGAAAAACVGVADYVSHQPAGSVGPVLWAASVLTGFGGAALVAALLVPITRFTPLVRMLVEWLELVAIVLALPLAAWIGGLFTWVRMR